MLDQVCGEWIAFSGLFTHAPLPSARVGRFVGIDIDPLEHLQVAVTTPHPAYRDWDPEPSAAFALMLLVRMRSRASALRRALVQEVALLKDDLSELILAWAGSLSPDVAEAYKKIFLCVPLFIYLLKLIGYPDADQLDSDLTHAF